ncbi:MAG: radical SAM protein [Caldisericum sp.]
MAKEIYSFCILPTTRCNLNCEHCYTRNVTSTYSFQDMDEEIAVKVVKGMSFFLETQGTYNLSVPIVGGEPLLVPFKVNKILFESLYKEIGKYNENFVIFFNTNLVNLSDDYIQLFKDYPVKVCASYDPEGVRFKNEDLHRKWCRNVEKLTSVVGERFYISLTVMETVFGKFDLYAFLSNLGVKNLMLSVFSPLGNALNTLDKLFKSRRRISLGLIAFSETAPFWLNVFFTKKDMLQDYKSFVDGFGGGIECWNDCYNTFSILPNGDVTTAGFCFTTEIFGNIIHDPPEKILHHPLRLEFMLRKTAYPPCFPCEYKDYCRCGCTSLAKIEDDSDCPGLKVYLDYVFKDVIPDDYYDFISGTWFEKYSKV